MTSNVSCLFRRHLRRAHNHLKALQRRQRATLAAPLEYEFQPGITTGPINEPASPKKFKDMPSAPGLPLLGTLPEFLSSGGVQNQHNYIARRHRELGGVFKESLAGHEFVYVSDPAAIRGVFLAEGQYPRHYVPEAWLLYNEDRGANRGLFFMEGKEWKTNRSILNRRLLRPDSIKPHYDTFGKVADALVQHWTTSYAGGVIPNLERELYRWAIESLGVMVFGNRLGFLNHNGPSGDNASFRNSDMEKFISAIHGIFKDTCAMGTFPPGLARTLQLPMWTRFADSVDRALEVGQKLVLKGLKTSKERIEKGHEPSSLIDQLMVSDRMEEADIVRLLADLFLAAADTTSHTAIWSLYLLGRHPHAVNKVRQEINAATGGDEVKGEHLASLPYLKGVVKEALRLYPVAPFLTRALDRDTLLGGHLVPAGTVVIISVYTTGRDEEQFPNPDKFIPERWVRDALDGSEAPSRQLPQSSSLSATPSVSPSGPCPFTKNTSSVTSPSASCPFTQKARSATANTPSRLHSHSFIPFGVGTRSCIGKRIAETQLHLMLAKIVQNADIKAMNEVDMVMRMVGVTSEPLQLRIDPMAKNA